MVEKVQKVDLGFLNANRRGVDDGITNEEPSMTEQQFKEQCDINNIVKQYTLAGYRSQDFDMLGKQVMADASRFIDVSNVPTLQEAHTLMEEAKHSFVQNVPAKIREHFDNDPMKFWQHASKAQNVDEIRALFGDLKNYSAPNATQLEEGNQLAVKSSKDE